MAEGNPQGDESVLARPLGWVTRQTLRRPALSLLLAVGAAVFCLALTATSLGFKTKRLDLLNPASQYNQRWLAYLEEFGDRDDALIVFQCSSPAAIPPAVDAIVKELEAQPAHFESILYRRDFSRLKAKSLHFLSLEELQKLDRRIADALSSYCKLEDFAQLQAAFAMLNRQLEQVPAGSPPPEPLVQKYLEILNELPKQLGQMPAAPADLGAGRMTAEMQRQFAPQYLTAENGQLGFVMTKLKSQDTAMTQADLAIAELRKLIAGVKKQYPDVWIGLTGMPVIEHDEMKASSDDTIYTSLLSLVGVFALFWAGFGGLRHSLLACAALLIGMAWSFGFVTIVVGHLNILSAAFGVILIGLGIDFGVHYVASYLRLRGQGLPPEEAIMQTAETVGPGVVTGGVTTVAAFFMAGLTEFVGVAELGIVAGGGILMCLAAAILTLPPLILLSDRNRPAAHLPSILLVGPWVRKVGRAPRLVFVAAGAVVLFAAAGLGGLWYDHNLLHLQPEHLQSAAIERDLFTRMDDSVWFAVSMCDSASELRERKARFERLSTVAKTEEIVSALPAPNPQKIQLIARLQGDLAHLPSTPPDPAAQIKPISDELVKGGALLDARQAQQAAEMVLEINRRLNEASSVTSRHAAAAGAQGLQTLQAISDPTPPSLADLPRELTNRYVGKNKRHLLKVYARGNIWDMDRLEKFVADVEGVDPQVTGHPVQTFYASRHMLRSYMHSGIYALIAVFILLYIDFQSVRMSLLAMTPLTIGCLVTAGTIGWLDIALNPANMIVLPLLLGIGVDDGVHLVHEFRRSRKRFEISDSTAVAVILTSTTTMVSFGTMILAQHRGLCSLGQVLTLGVMTCLFSSLLIFPAVLGWLSRHREAPLAEFNEHLGLAPAENLTTGELWVVPLRSESQDAEDEYAEVRPALRRRPLRRTA
jgi:hopanoid biosynthesis associated RND transporter like protein HpnN